MSTTSEALERESRRLCQRYVDEVVLRFDLCPWAAPALRAGRVEMSVITEQITNLEHDGTRLARAAFEAFERLFESPRTELVLLMLPRFALSRLELDAFQRMVREHQGTGEGTFALAAFHPEAHPDQEDPERLIPFLRRSPDPMLQAVRTTTLDRIDPSRGSGTQFMDLDQLMASGLLTGALEGHAAPESLRRRVARQNFETVKQQGLSVVERALDDIIEDRRRTYASLAAAG